MVEFNSLRDVYKYLKKELPRAYNFDFDGEKLIVYPFAHFETFTLRLFGRLLLDCDMLHITIDFSSDMKLCALFWFYKN